MLVSGSLWLSDKSEEEVAKVWDTSKLDEAIGLFPKECVYMRWKYEDAATSAHRRLLKWYHDKGLKVMGATAASAGDSPFMPRRNTRSEYVKGFSQLVADNQLEGILATAGTTVHRIWKRSGEVLSHKVSSVGTHRHGISEHSSRYMHSANMVSFRRITGWTFWMNWKRRSFSSMVRW